MAPFRPTNINKRAYPGNASVIGPSVTTTVGIATTSSYSSTTSCSACTNLGVFGLGCRYGGCACPCCLVCCCCDQVSYTKTVPSGMWRSSEQYESALRCSWGSGITTEFKSCTCLCCLNLGYTCGDGSFVDCKGLYICCGPSTTKWFVAQLCTQQAAGNLNWKGRSTAACCACACTADCSWFIPTNAQAQNPGYVCRTYWDYEAGAEYWTNESPNPAFQGNKINMSNGTICTRSHNHFGPSRAFACR